MWCMQCNNDLADCTCPDLMKRLTEASSGGYFAFTACRNCGKYHSQCKCTEEEKQLVRISKKGESDADANKES